MKVSELTPGEFVEIGAATWKIKSIKPTSNPKQIILVLATSDGTAVEIPVYKETVLGDKNSLILIDSGLVALEISNKIKRRLKASSKQYGTDVWINNVDLIEYIEEELLDALIYIQLLRRAHK